MKMETHDPIPKELLPNPRTAGDPALWENRVQNLMTAASPMLAQYRAAPVPWWAVLAERFRPHLAVAAVAAAVLMVAVHLSLPGPAVRSETSLSLAAVINESSAAATILSIANEEIDPVLALVILESETP